MNGRTVGPSILQVTVRTLGGAQCVPLAERKDLNPGLDVIFLS